jgi:cyclic pyranopterin monophosphate synthase
MMDEGTPTESGVRTADGAPASSTNDQWPPSADEPGIDRSSAGSAESRPPEPVTGQTPTEQKQGEPRSGTRPGQGAGPRDHLAPKPRYEDRRPLRDRSDPRDRTPGRPPSEDRRPPSPPFRPPAPTTPPHSFTHLDQSGRARMVDVGAKPDTQRTATARARILMAPETLRLIESGGVSKGDVLAVAQVAGVMGAKRTPDLIPLCHPLLLNGVDLDFRLDRRLPGLEITATVRVSGKTGVEMEALTAVTVAALTVYDMCKAVDRELVIEQVRLVHKDGGKSGEFRRRDEAAPPPRWEARREDRPDERFPRSGAPYQRRRPDDQRQGFSRPARGPRRPDDS